MFSVSIIVLGPFLTVVVGRIKIKNLGTTLNKIRGFFLPEILPDTGQEPGTQEAIILSKFLFLRFYCYPILSLTRSLNYHLYFDVKPITLKNPPGQGFVPNQIIPRFFLFKFFCIIRTLPES